MSRSITAIFASLAFCCCCFFTSTARAEDAPSCASADHGHSLTEAELDKIAEYVITRIVKTDSIPTFTLEEVSKATGVMADPAEGPAIKKAIMARLKSHPAVVARMSESRCAKFDACSINRDLSGATGDELAMYEREKAEDGKTYEDRSLPAFEALDLKGRKVKSQSLHGKPAVLTFLAGHCSHSMDSLSILQRLEKQYGEKGLRVVGVFVNSGTVEDMNAWIQETKPAYEVWVHTPKSIGDTIESHLVPTYFFVDAKGRVTEKLVGYKNPDLVDIKVKKLLGKKTANLDSDACCPSNKAG